MRTGLWKKSPSAAKGRSKNGGLTRTMTSDIDVQGAESAQSGGCDAGGGKWSYYLMKWLECCSGTNRGCGSSNSTVQPKAAQPASAEAASVLILAPSDVLHAVRSPFVNVRRPTQSCSRSFLISHSILFPIGVGFFPWHPYGIRRRSARRPRRTVQSVGLGEISYHLCRRVAPQSPARFAVAAHRAAIRLLARERLRKGFGG